MQLTLLPVELLIEILSQVYPAISCQTPHGINERNCEQVSRSDLKRLCEVSKLFNRLATPVLYISVAIKAESEVSLEEPGL